MNRCQAESYCNGYPGKCEVYCIGYQQLQFIYEQSGIPKKYQFDIPLKVPEVDRESYYDLRDFKENVEENVRIGKGLCIISPTKGNGKTSWACKIANEYIKKIALTNNLRPRVLFVNVPTFIERMKAAMDNQDEELAQYKEMIREVDLVIWDDIGTETPTTWVRLQLYTFIAHREAEMLSQIFTSNVPIEVMESEAYLGERIVSRIQGQCDVIEFEGPKWRGVNR